MKKKSTYSVWVYTNNVDLDSKLKTIAKKYNGKHSGSGYGFRERDNSFDFKDAKKANKFIAHVKRFKNVKRTELIEE